MNDRGKGGDSDRERREGEGNSDGRKGEESDRQKLKGRGGDEL